MRSDSTPLVPICGLLVAMLSISTGAALAKGLFPVFGPLGTAAVRFVIAALVMVMVLRGWRARITRENWPSLVLYGTMLCGLNVCFYMALTRLPLGIASAIEFTGPLAVSVIYSSSRKDYLWAALAMVGLLLLMPLGESPHALDPIGILWALASAICWGLYIIFGQRAGAQHGTQTAALGMVIAALIAFPIGAAEAGEALFRFDLLPLVILVALMTSAIPMSFEMFSLQRLPTRTFGVLLSIEPVIGAVVGFVVLHEALTVLQACAIALVVIACAGASRSARSKPIVPPQA